VQQGLLKIRVKTFYRIKKQNGRGPTGRLQVGPLPGGEKGGIL
jgi:hypothetical protein